MAIITPDKEFVKRKIQEAGKNKPPVCQKAVNEQEVVESDKKMKAMNIITPELKFVKRKITTKMDPGAKTNAPGSILTSLERKNAPGDVNPCWSKNKYSRIHSDISERGKRIPLGSKKSDLVRSDRIGSDLVRSDQIKSEFLGEESGVFLYFLGENPGVFSLLDTSSGLSPPKNW